MDDLNLTWLFDRLPLAYDIAFGYGAWRDDGVGRAEAIDRMIEQNADELQDTDDAPAVWIGLAVAMMRRAELVPEIRGKAMDALRQAQLHGRLDPVKAQELAQLLTNAAMG